MKVNLEDQGRQKVSFSFAPAKKPLQNPLFIPVSSDKPATESAASSDKGGQNTDGKTEQKQTPTVPTSAAEPHSQTPLSLATKQKGDLTKIHFKKQILSVSATEGKPAPAVVEEPLAPELPVEQKLISRSLTQFTTPQPHVVLSISAVENALAEASEAKLARSLKQAAASSGKDVENSSAAEQESKVYRRKTRSQSDNAHTGSESDGDSVQMSSTRKSSDSKSKVNSDSRSKEVKKSLSGSHVEEKEKSSSKRSENHERSSSYSRSDRDSRHTSLRSSRSDKDRRRTRSRSRSRSRGSRTSSSHSRSERSRGDRGSRSERSYYHDSDRRSHRSSPRRDRRRSRSRTDRTRDSSDSEDDHRKTRTRTSDSSRSSAHSSSHKDSKSSSYSKKDSPHSSELDKRTSSRTSKRLSDSDSQRKCSPDPDSSYRKSSSYHKSETNSKSSSSSTHPHSQTYERRQKSSSSDSEAEHKGKSQASDRGSGSEESCKNSLNKPSRSDSTQMTSSRSSVKTSEHDRQSYDIFHSPVKAPPCANATEPCSQSKREKADPPQGSDEHSNQDVKEMVACTDDSLQEPASKSTSLEEDGVNASALTSHESLPYVNVALENLTNVKDSLSPNNRPHVNSNAAVLTPCSSNDSITCCQDKVVVDCPPGPKSLIDSSDTPVTHDVQQNTKSEVAQSSMLSTVDSEVDVDVPLKSDCNDLETLEQQNAVQDAVKKSSGSGGAGSNNFKKSRWDIVGQDTPEMDNSQKALCAESKPTVKKVISVKQLDFSKEGSQQDSERKDAETHSIPVKQVEVSQQILGSDSTSAAEDYKDQSEPSRESTSIDHCDLKRTEKPTEGDPPHLNEVAPVGGKPEEAAHKSKPGKRAALSQSEASESDNSEYDSDSGEAIKRLHSVVVVPKNSSLTAETQDLGAPLCAMVNDLVPQHTAAELSLGEVPEQRQDGPPGGLEGTGHPGPDLSTSSMTWQSQSNMIDSTSHSESSSSLGAQPYVSGLMGVPGSVVDPSHLHQMAYDQGHEQYNISSGAERTHSLYPQDGFSAAHDGANKNGFGQAWEFSQAEQPSSTYQQPDSSHGPHLPNTKLLGAFPKEQGLMQSHASWNHQSPNVQPSRNTYLQHYQDPAGEIHPDSLTNDHDDYSRDKPANLHKTLECSGLVFPGSSSSVQGHEISSNSRGSAPPEPPREDSFRPHRGRGPPKKRRPEIESDSDNEAEAGPAGKRERLGDADVPKEGPAKTEAQRPILTLRDFQDSNKWKESSKSKKMPPYFDLIEENLYLTERQDSVQPDVTKNQELQRRIYF